MDAFSRRRLLSLAGRAAGFALASRSLGLLAPGDARGATRARAAAATPAAPAELIERNAWPEHWETTLAALDAGGLDTPNRAFFVRSHFSVPTIDPAAWELEVAGLVDHPFRLTAAELDAMPRSERRVTLECAGNGRGLLALANTSGTQWATGAVGTALWSGVALSDLLERAGVQPGAQHVWLETADHATLPQAPPFLRSLPLPLARERAIVARRMNGEPLPRLHGGPARLVMPGWYGMASAKWLTRVRVEARPSDNHFMIRGYRYVAPGGDPLTSPPVEAVRVKSLLTRPREGDAARAGSPLEVGGFAWSGAGDGQVKSVELTFDDGRTWLPAELVGDTGNFVWQRFDATVKVPRQPAPDARGTIVLAARATDATGEAQPATVAPNTGGYGNHAWHRVRLRLLAVLLAAASLGTLGALGVAGPARAAAPTPRLLRPYPTQLPKGDGRAVATQACLLCHAATLLTQQSKDSTAWERTIAQMEKWGAPVAPGDHALLRAYLVRTLGSRRLAPDPRGAPPGAGAPGASVPPAAPRARAGPGRHP